ncbi:unnamed protein product [Soboliphyme baturini]|uniref:Peptidase S1 domain-containing protein n=1 Tax=Soboliphyme baturini TaxID=241478 RepID=A0A183INL3_9BILA|nr:unnamed protein product [Soboliphyme baturini]
MVSLTVKVAGLFAFVSLTLGVGNEQISPLTSNKLPGERFPYQNTVFKILLDTRTSRNSTPSYRKCVATLFHVTSTSGFLVSSGREFFLKSFVLIHQNSVSIMLMNNASKTIIVNPISILVRRKAALSADFDITVIKISRLNLASNFFESPVPIATSGEEANIGFSCKTPIPQGQPLFCPLSHVGPTRKQTTVLAGISSAQTCYAESRSISLYGKIAPHVDWLNNAVTILGIAKPGSCSITEDQRLFNSNNKEKPPSCFWPSDYSGERNEAPADASLLTVYSQDVVGFGVYVDVENVNRNEHIIVAPAHLFIS